jgi:hypothetical protein
MSPIRGKPLLYQALGLCQLLIANGKPLTGNR